MVSPYPPMAFSITPAHPAQGGAPGANRREEAGEGRGRGGLGEPGIHPCVLPTQVTWILSSGGSTLIPVVNKRVKGLPCQDADEPQARWYLHQVFCRRGLKEGRVSH